mgnify:CR=1 FL=1
MEVEGAGGPIAAIARWSKPLAGGIVLPTGYSLRASTEVANTFNIFAFGGDL